MRKISKVKLITILITVFTLTGSQLLFADPKDVINQYIQAVRAEDWEKAESFWLGEEIEKSNRLGISFGGIEAKYDCASPLIIESDRLLNWAETVKIDYIDGDKVKAIVSLAGDSGDSVHIAYYLAKSGDNWKCCSPMHIYAGDWRILQTRYFNVHYDDSSLVNEFALHKLDDFIDTLGIRLNIPCERMNHLGINKIDYYLCDDNQIKLLTGFAGQGMTNFQFDAVITCHLPHSHELVHLMINYALEECPLFTLPILQEGVACYLGGRWGKSPEVINYWGNVSLNLGLADLDNLLTKDEFHNCPGGIDAAYAISSLYVGSLIDKFGIEKFRAFYTLLSGTNEYINSLSREDIKIQAEKIFNASWQEIEANLKDFTNQLAYSGIVPGIAPLDQGASRVEETDDIKMNIWDNGCEYVFQITLKPECQGGAVILVNNSLSANSPYHSKFFREQFPDKKYQGEMYGIQITEGEAGLYNYWTNMLLAKYVAGLTTNPNYWDPDKRIITFGLDKTLLDKDLGDYRIDIMEIK